MFFRHSQVFMLKVILGLFIDQIFQNCWKIATLHDERFLETQKFILITRIDLATILDSLVPYSTKLLYDEFLSNVLVQKSSKNFI